MTQFVRELEPLDQTVTQLLVTGLPLMTLQALPQPINRISQRTDIQPRASWIFPPRVVSAAQCVISINRSTAAVS